MYTDFGHSIVRRGQRKDGGLERARQPDAPPPTLPVVRGWMREVLGLLYNPHHRRLLGMLDGFRRTRPQRRRQSNVRRCGVATARARA